MAKGYAMSTLGKDRTGKALGSGRCESEDKLMQAAYDGALHVRCPPESPTDGRFLAHLLVQGSNGWGMRINDRLPIGGGTGHRIRDDHGIAGRGRY